MLIFTLPIKINAAYMQVQTKNYESQRNTNIEQILINNDGYYPYIERKRGDC